MFRVPWYPSGLRFLAPRRRSAAGLPKKSEGYPERTPSHAVEHFVRIEPRWINF